MSGVRFSVKQMFAGVTGISLCLCLAVMTCQSYLRTDWEPVQTSKDCWPVFGQFVEELEEQNIGIDNRELYSYGWEDFLSCQVDENVFVWLEGHLDLKEINARDQEVSRLIRVVADSPLSLPSLESNSTKFYLGVTGSTPDDPIRDHFFVVAYDRTTNRLLIWYYNLY